jgi:hypothetical protein
MCRSGRACRRQGCPRLRRRPMSGFEPRRPLARDMPSWVYQSMNIQIILDGRQHVDLVENPEMGIIKTHFWRHAAVNFLIVCGNWSDSPRNWSFGCHSLTRICRHNVPFRIILMFFGNSSFWYLLYFEIFSHMLTGFHSFEREKVSFFCASRVWFLVTYTALVLVSFVRDVLCHKNWSFL